jgi:hypothetical protein
VTVQAKTVLYLKVEYDGVVSSFWTNLTSSTVWSKDSYNVWWSQITQELMKFNARYEHSVILFETEEDMALFLLRWS